MRRPLLTLLLGLFAVGLLVGHWLFWYAPRKRAMEETDSRLVARLGAESREGRTWALWMPFPHQNLPALAGSAESLDRWLDAAVALSEESRIQFGPFAVPPCREIFVEGFADGTVTVEAVVYPGLGWIARAAGAIASNPWLGGGEVGTEAEPLSVVWREGVWTVAPPNFRSVTESPTMAPDTAQLEAEIGRLSLSSFAGPLPPGEYRIDHSSSDLRIESMGSSRTEFPNLELSGAALLLYSGAGSADGRAHSGLVLFDETADGEQGSSLSERGVEIQLPRLGVFYRDTEARWKLPGEGLARLLRLGDEQERQGWRARAWSGAAIESTFNLLDSGTNRAELAESDLAFLAAIDLDRARRLVSAVADTLESVPLLGRREAAEWRAWENVLAACPECAKLEVIARSGAASVRIVRSDGTSANDDG